MRGRDWSPAHAAGCPPRERHAEALLRAQRGSVAALVRQWGARGPAGHARIWGPSRRPRFCLAAGPGPARRPDCGRAQPRPCAPNAPRRRRLGPPCPPSADVQALTAGARSGFLDPDAFVGRAGGRPSMHSRLGEQGTGTGDGGGATPRSLHVLASSQFLSSKRLPAQGRMGAPWEQYGVSVADPTPQAVRSECERGMVPTGGAGAAGLRLVLSVFPGFLAILTTSHEASCPAPNSRPPRCTQPDGRQGPCGRSGLGEGPGTSPRPSRERVRTAARL